MMIINGLREAFTAWLPQTSLSPEESLLKCLERFQTDHLGKGEAASMQEFLHGLEVLTVDDAQKEGFNFELGEANADTVREALASWRVEDRRPGVIVFLLNEKTEVAATAIMVESDANELVVMGQVLLVDQKKPLAEEFRFCPGYFLANLCMTSALDQIAGPARITRGGDMGTAHAIWKDEAGEMYFRSVPNLDMVPPHQYTKAQEYPEVIDLSGASVVLIIT